MQTMLRLSGKEISFDFTVTTAAYQKYVATRGSRWPEQERIGRAPALQHVGLTTAESTLEGVIYPGVAGKAAGSMEEGLSKLHQLATSSEPFLLTTGTGEVCGYWAVLSTNDTRSIFLDNGQARKVEFTLQMRYYGPDYVGGSDGGLSGAARMASPRSSSTLAKSGASSIQALSDLSSTIEALPSMTSSPSLAAINAMADAAGNMAHNVVSLASEVAGYIQNPLSALGLGFDILAAQGLPLEVISGIGAVASSAHSIIEVGEQTLDTLTAVKALNYTLSTPLTTAGQHRLNDIAATMKKDLIFMRDTAMTHEYGTEVLSQHMGFTGRTLEHIPQRQAAAQTSFTAAQLAADTRSLCQDLSTNCTLLLEKFA